MILSKTLNFRLILEKNTNVTDGSTGKFYVELVGESSFDYNKSFEEKFYYNLEGQPFNKIEDVAKFSQDMSNYWEKQLISNPKLNITSIEQLADIWKKFAATT